MEVLATYEHSGRSLQLSAFEDGPPRPKKTSCPRTPGGGCVEIGPIVLGHDGETPTLTARVTGWNVAYLYTEVLLKDPLADRYYGPLTREHIRAHDDKEVRGMSHPVWSDPMEFTVALHPSLPLLTDGVSYSFCSLTPAGYDSPEHRLSGLFTHAHGAPVRASLTLDGDGGMRNVVAHKTQGGHSLPRSIIPRTGDHFSPLLEVLTPPIEGREWLVSRALSTPLTFSDRRPRVVVETPMPGSYLVGLVAQDMDGGFTRAYLPVDLPARSQVKPALPDGRGGPMVV